eukprot:1189300-Prorocentrum_minimum.AAC.4
MSCGSVLLVLSTLYYFVLRAVLSFGDVAPALAGGFPGSASGFPTLTPSYVSALLCLRIFRRSYALSRRWFQQLAATLFTGPPVPITARVHSTPRTPSVVNTDE